MNTWIVALAGLGLVLAARKKGSPIMPEDTVKPGEGEPQLALASGDPKDPEIAALLIEFDDYLSSNGAGRYTMIVELHAKRTCKGGNKVLLSKALDEQDAPSEDYLSPGHVQIALHIS